MALSLSGMLHRLGTKERQAEHWHVSLMHASLLLGWMQRDLANLSLWTVHS